jgi:hypothetical protein
MFAHALSMRGNISVHFPRPSIEERGVISISVLEQSGYGDGPTGIAFCMLTLESIVACSVQLEGSMIMLQLSQLWNRAVQRP